MIRIFVTVGTTKFDSLIKYIDENFINSAYEIKMQIADGSYVPKNFFYFRFDENIERFYKESDVIITHAGAGTIYRLLELEKKFIIVPNLERKDKHQLDIANFMKNNDYAKVVMNFNEIEPAIKEILFRKFKKFKKENFFLTRQIIQFLT